MGNAENREHQTLEQLGSILVSLDPDSYIAEALREVFGKTTEHEHHSSAVELQRVRLPKRTVHVWETNRGKALQHQLAKAEAYVAVLKAELYDLTVKR